MSLLLEALKKAEKAKEDAERRTQARPEAAAGAPAAPAIETPAPVVAFVRTRDQLPDIGQSMEIVAEEPAAQSSAPALALAEDRPAPEKPARQPAAAPRTQAPAAQGDEMRQAGERAAARKVFEAKFREPNPRLPFFIALGVLGVFAVGTVTYFWIQLRPAASLVNLNPKPPAGGAQVASSAPRPSPSPASGPSPQQPMVPGLPGAASTLPAVPSANAPARPEPAARVPETPLLKPPVRPSAAPRTAPEPAPEVSASRAAPQVHSKVSTGYAAYLAGDLATARTEYEQALREEPANRDALLGMAALDVRAGRFEAAEAGYLRLLRSDPRDAHAHAGMIALRGGRFDPVAAESRVKSMLAENPGAHVLNFTLGNQFAQQGRWAEAQQEYFKAFAAEPDNADFAYNLAVSLDHLRQPKLALEYYQRALALAKARGARFDLAAAEARAAQLGR